MASNLNSHLNDANTKATPNCYSIRALATEFSITTRTIRFYEQRGFISSIRDGQKRLFTEAHRNRLANIIRGRNLGLTLSQIQENLGHPEGEREIDLVKTMSSEMLQSQIHYLEQLRAEVSTSLAELLDEQRARIRHETASNSDTKFRRPPKLNTLAAYREGHVRRRDASLPTLEK